MQLLGRNVNDFFILYKAMHKYVDDWYDYVFESFCLVGKTSMNDTCDACGNANG